MKNKIKTVLAASLLVGVMAAPAQAWDDHNYCGYGARTHGHAWYSLTVSEVEYIGTFYGERYYRHTDFQGKFRKINRGTHAHTQCQ